MLYLPKNVFEPEVERNMNRHQRPKCPICGEPIYHDKTRYGAAPLDDLDACYECTQEALKGIVGFGSPSL